MQRNWVIGALALAVMLALPGIAVGATLSPINEANMQLAWDNVETAAGASIAPDADYDDDGLIERDAMGCFGALYAANGLPAAVKAAFDANVAAIDAIDGSLLEPTVPGFELVIAWLTTIIGDGEGDSTSNVVNTIEGFTTAGGAGGIDGASGTSDETECACAPSDAGFDNSQDAAATDAVYTECGISSLDVIVNGSDSALLGGGDYNYTASTLDVDGNPPDFSAETHTFSSSNAAVLAVTAGGVATGIAEGTADVIATGDDSDTVGTKTVTVRYGEWWEVCAWDDVISGEGAGLILAAGCDFYGTNVFHNVDSEGGVGDLVPDYFQVNLVAYLLCTAGSDGPAKDIPDAAAVLAQFEENLAEFETSVSQLEAIADWFSDGVTSVDITGTLATTTGGSTILTGTSTGGDTAFIWNSLDTTKATVPSGAPAGTATGTVTGVAEGSAKIAARGVTTGVTHIVTVGVDNLATDNAGIGATGLNGSNEVNAGGTGTLTAATVGTTNGGEAFGGWISSNPAAVTVLQTGANTASFSAVAVGSSNVTAVGAGSGIVPSITINVLTGEGCDLAKAGDGSKATGSGVRKAYSNLQTLWNGPGTGGTGSAGGGYATVLAFAGAGAANGLNSGIFGPIAATVALVNGMDDLTGALAAAGAVKHYIIAEAGVSQEADGFTQAIFNGTGVFPAPFSVNNFFAGPLGTPVNTSFSVGSIAALAGGFNASTGALAGVPIVGTIRAACTQLVTFTTPANLPGGAALASYTPVNYDVYGSGFNDKVAGLDPLDAGSVFNPDPETNPTLETNLDLSAAVIAAGGDEYDFVDLAAGINLFATGSPFLPAAGAIALGLLAGGLAFSAARRLRRNS